MTASPQQIEKEFIENIVDTTGRSLKDWMALLSAQSFTKTKESVDWLKKRQGLKHLPASMLAGIYLNGGQPVYANEKAMLAKLFENKEHQTPIYDELQRKMIECLPRTSFRPTKTYISMFDKREFAVAKINTKEIRIGLDLGDAPFDEYVVKSKSLGAMPRISHMIEVRSAADINANLLKRIMQAYERVHNV